MKTAPALRWLPAAVLLALMFGGCLNPSPRHTATPQPIAELLFPTRTPPIRDETAAALPSPTANPTQPPPPEPTLPPVVPPQPLPTDTKMPRTLPTPTTAVEPPEPAPAPEPANLSLQNSGTPEDVRDVIQRAGVPPTGNPLYKTVQRGDPLCHDDLQLMQVAGMLWPDWPVGGDVLVTVFFPDGVMWQDTFQARQNGGLYVTFQAAIGQPVGTYQFVLDNGQDHRECSLTYRAADARAALYLIPASPFEPATYSGIPFQSLLLYGFAPSEPVRLLAYRTDGWARFDLLGWQNLQTWENGQLQVDLGESEPGLVYAVTAPLTGELHLLLPDLATGRLVDPLEGLSVLQP